MPRSRKGCNTCKKRHRKCDETKPACRMCQAYGLQCEGYAVALRWMPGGGLNPSASPASRRQAAELVVESRVVLEPDGESIVLPKFDDDSPQASSSSRSGSSNLATLDTTMCTNPNFQQRPGPEDEAQIFQLVREFMSDTVYSLIATTRDSPFPGLLNSLAQTSETLRVIVAAMHLYFSNPEAPGPAFQEYSTRGMHSFRRQLDHYDGSLDAAILAAGLLICTLNLFQSLPWSPTLKHMINAFGISGSTLPNMSSPACHPVIRYTIEAMGVMDVPNFIRGRTPRTFGIWRELRASQAKFSEGGGFTPDRNELVSALPWTLIDLLAQIEDPKAEEALLNWPGEVGEIPLCHHWEAYRLAGILNCRRHHGAETKAGWSGNNNNQGGGVAHESSATRRPSNDVLVARIVAHLDALWESSGRPEYSNYLTLNAVLFPYAAARLEVSVLFRHAYLMDHLRRLKASMRPYAATENARMLEAMLDEAYDTQNDLYDLDEECRKRGVEISLF